MAAFSAKLTTRATQQEFSVPQETAITHVAFGGNDYGIDGLHFDPEKRNLYLFQFSRDFCDQPGQGAMRNQLTRMWAVRGSPPIVS